MNLVKYKTKMKNKKFCLNWNEHIYLLDNKLQIYKITKFKKK